MTPRRVALVAAAVVLPTLALFACGGEKEKTTFGPAPGGSGAPAANAAPAQSQPQVAAPNAADAGADGSAALANLAPLPPASDPDESAFTESDRNRDPFHPFDSVFGTQERARAPLQRNALADKYGLEDLKLMGIVTRAPPRALLADPTGIGWVAKVGDFVGRAEVVQKGPGGVDVPLNWRVDRIRSTDVVFVRTDPSRPDLPAMTRVIPLYPVEQAPGAAPASPSH